MTTPDRPTVVGAIKSAMGGMSTNAIIDIVKTIGGGSDVTRDERIVRAAAIDVYAEREGIEAADDMMDDLGM